MQQMLRQFAVDWTVYRFMGEHLKLLIGCELSAEMVETVSCRMH